MLVQVGSPPLAAAGTAAGTAGTGAAQAVQSPEFKEAAAVAGEEVTIPIATVASPSSGIAPIRRGELIVRFKDATPALTGAQGLGALGVQAAAPLGRGGMQLMRVAPGADLAATLAKLRQDPRVAYAEPNYELLVQADPNDPRFGEQWGMVEVEATWAWGRALGYLGNDINKAAAVTVAVIDTGVDANHEDLTGRVLIGQTVRGAVYTEGAPDDSGHGTHVAGIIAAATNNGVGVAGVAGEFPVRILPVKVLDSAGVGTMYDVAQGIRWAADWRGPNGERVRVINLSLGARLPDYPMTLAEAVRYAQDQGALVVAAAGNDHGSVNGFYPASLPGVMSVAASNPDGSLASFSNYGAEVTAPGVEILSTWLGQPGQPDTWYRTMSGTSMAAPFASGTAALLWSVYPQKLAAEVAEAIQQGKFWDHLRADDALGELHGGSSPENSLDIINPPFYGYGARAHVAGTVPITVKAGNPANVAYVVFTLDPPDDLSAPGTVLGTVYGLAGGGKDESGLFTMKWDSTTVPDGPHTLWAHSYGADGMPFSYYGAYPPSYITVANQPRSGLSLQFKKPDGTAATGAAVTVYHAVYSAGADGGGVIYETVWDGSADLQGQVIIPGATATDGNDYLVTAQGTEPNFLYYKTVRAPAHAPEDPRATLDASDAQRIALSGQQVDGQPLGTALILSELLEANLPAPADPSRVIASVPVATLNAAGTAEVTLTRGHYNLRLLSDTDAYYLVHHDFEVTGSTTAFNFHPGAGDVATLRLAPDGAFDRFGLLLSDVGDYLYGFARVGGLATVTVTPGTYSAVIDAVYRDRGKSTEWLWGIAVPIFQAGAGEDHPLPFGGPIQASLSVWPGYTGQWSAGTMAWFETHFPDQQGNLTESLAWQPYTASVAGNPSNLGAGGILRRAVTAAPKLRLPVKGTATAASKPASTFAYNPATGRFEVVAQAGTYVVPNLEITDNNQQVVPADTIGALYGIAWWIIPASQSVGTYFARVTLAAGPLGPATSGGLAESGPVTFEVQNQPPPPAADLTVHVKDRQGAAMVGARVTLLRRVARPGPAGTAYYPVPNNETGQDETYTDNQGDARYESMSLDPQGTYALAIYGSSPDPANPAISEKVFLFVPLSPGQAPLSVTVDASDPKYSLTRVVIRPLDKDGVSGTFSPMFFLYAEDASGARAGVMLEDADSCSELPVWVPQGRYVFQADMPWAWGNDLYHLVSGPLNVPTDVPIDATGDRVVTLGGTGLTSVVVAGPPAPDVGVPEYYLGGVAFFSPGLPTSAIFYPQNNPLISDPIYVMPGSYQAEAALVRHHYDGPWDYWLDGEINAAANATVTWAVYGTFTAHLSLETTTASHGLGDTVRTNHLIEDANGNRLVAVRTGIEYLGGESLGIPAEGTGAPKPGRLLAWRVPGAGPHLTRVSGATGPGDPIQAQNHEEIAPFLVIRDFSGKEVYRHKDAGPSIDRWNTPPDLPASGGQPATGTSTFFRGEYTIPQDAPGGIYTAILELGTGPEGMITDQTTIEVKAVPAAPHLGPPISPTKATTVTLTGTTLPGAAVTVHYRLNSGLTVEVGTVTAEADGHFSLDVTLPGEGTYAFTATATRNGLTSPASPPVTLVVDQTPPGSPDNLVGVGQDQTHILLTWKAPAAPDVASYRILRDGTFIGSVASGGELRFLDSDLQTGVDYHYQVIAVDQAGNESQPSATKTARTKATGDQEPPSVPTNLRATARLGGIAQLTWDAATDNVGVAGYRIWRATGNGPATVVGTVYADSAQSNPPFQDTGLDAETTYTYTVTAFDAAGNQSDHSDPFGVTTPALSTGSLTWAVGRSRNWLALPGSNLQVILSAEPNRQAVAEVVYQSWYDAGGAQLSNPGPASVTLSLAEDKDSRGRGKGLYRGSTTLAPGSAELTSIAATLSDGAGHATRRTAAGLPLKVTGSLLVEVLAPPTDVLKDSRLMVWSDTAQSGASRTFDAAGTYSLDGLAPATDYRLRILDAHQRQLAQEGGVAVVAGRVTQLAVSPRLPADLQVLVLDPLGNPVPRAAVQFDNESTRQSVSRFTDQEGRTEAVTGPFSGDDVQVVVRLIDESAALRYRNDAQGTFTLKPGGNLGTIQLQALPVGTLTGRAKDPSGQSLAGVVVTASQQVDGRFFTRSAKTGDDGHYSLELLVGDATVEAALPNTKYATAQGLLVSVPASGQTLVLDAAGPGTVTAAVYTRYLGDVEWTGPLDMDWRVAVHFRLTVTDASGHTSSASAYQYPPAVWGRPGDTVKVSVDGREAGLPAVSQSVQLDAQRHANAVFRLEEMGRIKGRLIDVDGQPLSEADRRGGWWAHLWSVDDTGQKLFIGRFSGDSDQVRIPLPASGQFQVRIYLKGDSARNAERTVSVAQGEENNLGEIRLSRLPSLLAGRLVATPREAAPGTTVTLRAEFGPAAGKSEDIAAQQATLILEIPSGTTLVPQSVTMDGQPAVATVSGNVTLNLGDLTISPGKNKVVTYQVRLNAGLDAGTLTAGGRIEWGDAQHRLRDDLVPVAVPVAQVNLNAPTHIARLNTWVSGRSPAGAIVKVYDENLLLGEAQASPGGFWGLAVTLPDRGSPSRHRVHARVDTATGALHSPEVYILYDSDTPELLEFTMRQADGRTMTINPSQGVARFPYVVVPGMHFSFDLRFNDPSRVSDVEVLLGGGKASAVSTGNGMGATLTWPGYSLGPVYVKYKTKPKASALKLSAPTEVQLRQRLPLRLSDFTLRSSGGTPPPADQPQAPGTGWVEFAVPNRKDMTVRADLTIRRGVSYTPTADEEAKAASSGVPVYGYSFDYSVGANELVVNVSGYIPESYLDTANPGTAAAYLLGKDTEAGGTARFGALGAGALVQVGAKLTFRVGPNEVLNAADWTKSLADGFDVPDKFKELEGLLDQAESCDPGMANVYRDSIDRIAQRVMVGEATKWGLQITGVLLGPETFGLGTLVLFGVSQAMEWAIDAGNDKMIKNVQDMINGDPSCKREDQKKKKVADPTWIWDPSGHVYEGVDENRVEGVTTTIFQRDPTAQTWSVWDAAWFAQENPLVTDPMGRYGWDVPPGEWQVVYEKPGYEPAQSPALPVPPPQTEVNVGLVSLAAPVVQAVTPVTLPASGGYIDITFDKYMRASTLTNSTVTVFVYGQTDEFGQPIAAAGNVEPVSPVPDPNHSGVSLTRTARFAPAAPLTVGSSYVVSVSHLVQSYAEQPMAADVSHTVTVSAAGEVSNAQVVPGDGRLTVTWTDPPDAGLTKIRVYWRPLGGNYGGPVEVPKSVQTYTISGLSNATTYEIKLTTVDAVGSESAGVTVTGVPAASTTSPGPRRVTSARPDELRTLVETAARRITAFDGAVTLDLAADTFTSGVTLVVRRLAEPAWLGGEGLGANGPVYEFDTGGVAPRKPVAVSIRYDGGKLGGIDPRKLGLYRQDDHDPSVWTYVGGVVDQGAGVVRARLKGFSRYAVMTYNRTFGDLSGHWGRKDVEVLVSRHVVQGVSDREFQPERSITRAELTKLLVGMLTRDPDRKVTLSTPATPTFSDVAPDAWYYAYVETAASQGLVKGENGRFRPDDPVTREETAVMLLRAMGLEAQAAAAGTGTLTYDDADQVAAWARGFVALAWQRGLMQGMTASTFGPRGNATRAQGAVVVLRAMERLGLIVAPATVSGTVPRALELRLS